MLELFYKMVAENFLRNTGQEILKESEGTSAGRLMIGQ